MDESHKKALDRVAGAAERHISDYQTSAQLLVDAMRDAAPWVMGFAMKRHAPRVSEVETLCARLLAIVMASESGGGTNG